MSGSGTGTGCGDRLERSDLLVEPGEHVVPADALGQPLDPPATVVLVELERELDAPGQALQVEGVQGRPASSRRRP